MAGAQEIATEYACKREAFGKLLIDHEGVGFPLAENGIIESSMAKVAVCEALLRIADRCVQVMGGMGVTACFGRCSRNTMRLGDLHRQIG